MSNESKLGIFILIVILIFFFFTINMGTIFFEQAKTPYKIHFKEIGTLEMGAPVKQAGFDIGQVNSIALKTIRKPTPEHFIELGISVNNDAIVSPDSTAMIQTLGMMGEKYVEITFGSGEKAPPNTVIRGESPKELDELMQNAVKLTQDVGTTVRSLNSIFGNEQLQANIVLLVENLEQISDNFNKAMGGETNRLNNILENAELASAGLHSLMATTEIFIRGTQDMLNENRISLRELLANANNTFANTSKITDELQTTLLEEVQHLARDLNQYSKQLGETLERTHQIFAKVDKLVDEEVSQSLSNIKETTDHTKKATSRLDEMMKQVQTESGLLHDFIYDEELSLSTKETIRGASDFLGGVSGIWDRFSLVSDVLYFTERPGYNNDHNNVRADLGVEFDLSDSIFMFAGGNNLGASNDLQLQFGYEWGPIRTRYGIKESEASLGLEWQIFKRWMLGIEGVGLTNSGNERMDIYSELWLWENISMLGGVQDVTDDVYPNVGLRFRF